MPDMLPLQRFTGALSGDAREEWDDYYRQAPRRYGRQRLPEQAIDARWRASEARER